MHLKNFRLSAELFLIGTLLLHLKATPEVLEWEESVTLPRHMIRTSMVSL